VLVEVLVVGGSVVAAELLPAAFVERWRWELAGVGLVEGLGQDERRLVSASRRGRRQ
jgi:hypothetical protein